MAFSGVAVEIPLGIEGLSGNPNHAELGPGHLVTAQNVSYWSGTLRRESGALLYTPTPLAGAITSGYTWLGGTRSIITVTPPTGPSELRKDTGPGTFATVLATAPTAFDLIPTYAEGGEEDLGTSTKLFVAWSPNAPRVVLGDADTATAITGAPPEWAASGPATFVLHEGRMWGVGAGNDPHRVYFSSTTDHEKFLAADGGGNMLVYAGEGDRIVAALSFKGLLIIWKSPGGIYSIDTSNLDPQHWRVTRISQFIGTRGPGCVTMLDNDVIFLDHAANVQLISGITEFGQIGTANLTRTFDIGGRLRREIVPERLHASTVQFVPARREIHVTLMQRGPANQYLRLIIDMNRAQQPYRFRIVNRDTAQSLWLAEDNEGTKRPMIGDQEGRVWRLDQPGVTRTGVGYPEDDPVQAIALTPELDFGMPTKRKLGKFLEAYVTSDVRSQFLVEVYWDGIWRQTIDFDLQLVGWPLGPAPNPFPLDTGWLAGGSLTVRRARMVGSGRRLQLRVVSKGVGEDFSIARLYVSGAVGEEREPVPRFAPGESAASFGVTRGGSRR
jgi:hypothetical protein